jgi:cytochrome c oxidase subunit 2
MQKWIMSVLVVVACVIGVALLANGMPAKPVNEADTLKPGQQLLQITASSSNFEFDQKEYHVKAGTNYKITFRNKLGKHGFEIKDLGIDLNESKPTLEYTFDKPGTYQIHCSIMCGQGHATMASTIVVE